MTGKSAARTSAGLVDPAVLLSERLLAVALAHGLTGGRDAEAAASDMRAIGRDAAEMGLTWTDVERLCDHTRHRAVLLLRAVAVRRHVSATVLERADHLLGKACDQLTEAVEDSYRAHIEVRLARRQQVRTRLAARILAGDPAEELARAAEEADWPLPEECLVVAVREAGPVPRHWAGESLRHREAPYWLLIDDARRRASLLEETAGLVGDAPVAIGPVVPFARISEAVPLVRRLLDLAAIGIVEPRPVLDCADHEVELWLHGEPLLRQRLAARLLAPLTEETPHRRRVLAMTLLVWLERRPSAAMMAEELGVHPQTVRYRLRQLRAMFGDVLDEPGEALALQLVLQATLPWWTANLPEGSAP